jgi:hypothetical protein
MPVNFSEIITPEGRKATGLPKGLPPVWKKRRKVKVNQSESCSTGAPQGRMKSHYFQGVCRFTQANNRH